MSFLHPLLLWGTLLGSIPIIIHILSRRRYRVVRWAAVDFLLSALSERSRNVRLQDLLLLLLRTVALVVAALVVARPILSPGAPGLLGLGGRMDAVLVLDTSYSMDTVVTATTRMALARQRAHEVLAALPDNARIGVIYMDDDARPATDGLLADRARIGAAIDAAETSATGTNALPAIEAALDMLRESAAATKQVFLFTDAQARAFEQEEEALQRVVHEADESVGFVVIQVPNAPVPNLAVTDLKVLSRWLRVGAPVVLEARIRDVGADRPDATPAQEAEADLWVDGRRVDRRRVTLTEGEGTARFRHTFTAAGLFPVEVQLEPDALPVDNHRYVAVHVPPAIEVLVVTPADGAARHESAYTYLEAALGDIDDPDEAATLPPFVIRPRVSPDRVATELDDEVAVVVLTDPGSLPPDAVRRIAQFVDNGGSVLVSAGPNAAATLGPFRSGQPGIGTWMTGLDFTMPEDPEPARGAAVQRFDVTEAAGAESRHDVLDLESPGVRDALGAVQVFASLGVEVQGDSGWAVALRLANQEPALLTRNLVTSPGVNAEEEEDVAAAAGSGRLALFTSTLDPRWCDLPYRPAMVPLVHDVVMWLVRHRLTAETLEPRQTWTPRLARIPAGARIMKPDDESVEAAGFLDTDEAGAPVLRFDLTESPGVYRLTETGGVGQRAPDAMHAVAVNVDVAESDQTTWSRAELTALFPEGRSAVVAPDAPVDLASIAGLTGREIWWLAAVLLIALLIAETVLAYLFGLRKPTGTNAAPRTGTAVSGASAAAGGVA